MRQKKLPYISFLFLTILLSCAQFKRTIYLGPQADSLFVSGPLAEGSSSDNRNLYEFLGYQTFRHEPIGQNNKENINRIGLILPAKGTENINTKAEAVFGKNDNTCFIVYDASIEKITKGRSAAVSIMNLFSKEEDKTPQDDPSSNIGKVKVEGKISLVDQVVDFTYSIRLNKDYPLAHLTGQVWFRNDSLLLQPIKTYLNKWGKKKKGYVGYRLIKGETTYAAVDTYDKRIIYINKTISEEEKLLAAAYFFIVACYMQYHPPFVDMAPPLSFPVQ